MTVSTSDSARKRALSAQRINAGGTGMPGLAPSGYSGAGGRSVLPPGDYTGAGGRAVLGPPAPYTGARPNGRTPAGARVLQQPPGKVLGQPFPKNVPLPGGEGLLEDVETPAPSMPLFGKTLQDYLGQINGEDLVRSILDDIAAREASLRQRGKEGDENLARIYAALVSQIQGQDKDIASQYDQTRQSVNENARLAAEAMRGGTQQSQDMLARTAANLGLDTEGHGRGTLAFHGSHDLSDAVKYGQSAADYVTQLGAGQRDFNRTNATAAGFRGAEERSALARTLMQMLGGLNTERASAIAQGNMQAQNLAQQQYQSDYNQFRDQRDFSAGRDDEAWRRSMAEQELQAQMAAANQPQSNPLASERIFNQLNQQVGPAAASNIWTAIVNQSAAPGSARNLTPNNFARNVREEVLKMYPNQPALAVLAAQYALEMFNEFGG